MVNYFFFSYKANLNIDGSGAVVAAPDQNTPGKFYLEEVCYIILHLTFLDQIGLFFVIFTLIQVGLIIITGCGMLV